MMKKTVKKIAGTLSKRKLLSMALVLGMSSLAFAGPIGTATGTLATYRTEIGGLVYAIGGIVGFVGGLRIYNKWQNGDQDVNKELLGYGGAMIFLFIVPTIVGAFFP
nr:DUF4134 family protein [Epilithonimonas caeni]